MRVLAVALAAVCGGALPAAPGPGLRLEDLYAAARAFEVKPLPAEPEWAHSEGPPLLRFAWLSDLHLSGDERTPVIRQACRAVREEIRPHFAVFTGDNSSYDPPVSGERAALSQSHRRQLAFKDFLDAELGGIPAAVIAGDNWPWDFEKVFGPGSFSFDAAGLHFVFLSPDRKARGAEGCAVFAAETWEWLARDLDANRARPTLVLLHENVVPPDFLDAPALLRVLKAHPQVLGTLTGHLHLDLDFRRDGMAHLVCPAMVRGARPAFKVAELHADRLVLNTWEYDPARGTFAPTLKWQRIDIPAGPLRESLHPVDAARVLRENRSESPAPPLAEDAALLERRGELFLPMMQFLLQMGMQAMAP